ELTFFSPSQAPAGERFLLGFYDDGGAYFGVAGSLATAPGAAAGLAAATGLAADGRRAAASNGQATGPGRDPGVRRAGLREAGTLLTDRDAGLLTHAVALANWHAVAGFCPRCGGPTKPETAGHSRRCTNDGSEHFPRSDPAVIMSVTDPGDRILLARNAQWPPGRVSVLAGFVEPGESAEQAVAREVHEETGVVVAAATYAGSQPWPMPHNLMLGFRARAEGTAICVDDDEIAEARWYSRDDLRHALETGALKMPPSLSISRWLIETWYGADLPRPAS
ncbi:MAG: NAD(+) diphosphatase, partial [Streptosporangiaceae bacterium]